MKLSVLVVVTALIAAATAGAAAPPLGARVGYTSWEQANQIHFGGQVKLGDVVPNIALTPKLEIGFGDGATVVAVNGDLAYRFTELSEAPWGPYAGGCISFIWIDPEVGGADSDLGLSGLVGTTYALSSGNEVFAEVRLGIMDSPGFKVTVGYTFF
jgi:hypothetical protein